MKHLTLSIEENKYDTFIGIIDSLDYVKVESMRDHALQELGESLKQVKDIQDGKMSKMTMKDLLDEL